MKKLKEQFVDSFRELKEVKVLAITAMMIALGIVLDSFSVQVTEYLKIGFSGIPNNLVAMMFGPVVGGLMGGAADVIKYFLRPTGPFFFGFTLNAILAAVIYGMFYYKKKMTFLRILCAKATVAVTINVILGTYWVSVMYGNAFFAMLPARVVKQAISVPVDTIVFFLIVKVLSQAKVFVMARTKHTGQA